MTLNMPFDPISTDIFLAALDKERRLAKAAISAAGHDLLARHARILRVIAHPASDRNYWKR
jgi:hypothetical protein